jgi:putative transposase
LDEPHLIEAVRYVERNPVRTGLVSEAWAYPWSSARAHTERIPDAVLAPDCPILAEIEDWRAYLRSPGEDLVLRQLRANTRTGRPLGGEGFIEQIERLTGRSLTPRPRGRPRQESHETPSTRPPPLQPDSMLPGDRGNGNEAESTQAARDGAENGRCPH